MRSPAAPLERKNLAKAKAILKNLDVDTKSKQEVLGEYKEVLSLVVNAISKLEHEHDGNKDGAYHDQPIDRPVDKELGDRGSDEVVQLCYHPENQGHYRRRHHRQEQHGETRRQRLGSIVDVYTEDDVSETSLTIPETIVTVDSSHQHSPTRYGRLVPASPVSSRGSWTESSRDRPSSTATGHSRLACARRESLEYSDDERGEQQQQEQQQQEKQDDTNLHKVPEEQLSDGEGCHPGQHHQQPLENPMDNQDVSRLTETEMDITAVDADNEIEYDEDEDNDAFSACSDLIPRFMTDDDAIDEISLTKELMGYHDAPTLAIHYVSMSGGQSNTDRRKEKDKSRTVKTTITTEERPERPKRPSSGKDRHDEKKVLEPMSLPPRLPAAPKKPSTARRQPSGASSRPPRSHRDAWRRKKAKESTTGGTTSISRREEVDTMQTAKPVSSKVRQTSVGNRSCTSGATGCTHGSTQSAPAALNRVCELCKHLPEDEKCKPGFFCI